MSEEMIMGFYRAAQESFGGGGVLWMAANQQTISLCWVGSDARKYEVETSIEDIARFGAKQAAHLVGSRFRAAYANPSEFESKPNHR